MDPWVLAHMAADAHGPTSRKEILEFWLAVGIVFGVMFLLVGGAVLLLRLVGAI